MNSIHLRLGLLDSKNDMQNSPEHISQLLNDIYRKESRAVFATPSFGLAGPVIPDAGASDGIRISRSG